MNKRLKQLRKALNLTQQEFSDKLGISRNNIAAYETGRSNLGDSVVHLICNHFKVNEQWFRTGEGEMFIKITNNRVITNFISNLLLQSSSPNETIQFKINLIVSLAKLNESQWEILAQLSHDITKNMNNCEN